MIYINMQVKDEQYVKHFIELRRSLDVKVKRNVKSAQQRQKKHYDAKHAQGCYQLKARVMLKNMKKIFKKGDKLAPNWTGPYEIGECLGSNTYRLKKMNGDYLKSKYNSTRLKLFHERGLFHIIVA